MGLLDGFLDKVSASAQGGDSSAQGQDSFSGLLGSLGIGAKAGDTGLMTSAMSLLQEGGGLNGVLDKFRQSGLAAQVESWISTGPNLGITSEQIHQVFGAEAIGGVASKLGVSVTQAGSALAQLLPELINKLTPEGRVPENHSDLIAEGLAKLKSWTA